MADPEVRLRRRQPHGEALLLGDRLHDVADRFEDVGDRERNRIEIDQPVAAAGQLDDVARHRAEAEGGAVDEAELALLDRIDRAAPAPLERLGQEEDRGEGRAKIVGDLDHQLEPVGSGEPVGEVLRPVGLEPLAHRSMAPSNRRSCPASGGGSNRTRSTKGAADQPERAGATEAFCGTARARPRRGPQLLPDRHAELRQVAVASSAPEACSSDPFPLRLRPQHGLAQRIPERRGDAAGPRGPSGSQTPGLAASGCGPDAATFSAGGPVSAVSGITR